MVRKALRNTATSCTLLLVVGSGVTIQAGEPNDRESRSPATSNDDAMTTWYVDAELIPFLEKEASRLFSGYLENQGVLRVVDNTVSIDMKRRKVIVDFGPGFRPGPDDAEMFLQEMATTLRNHVEETGLPNVDVDFLYQGKPLRHYFPEELAVPPQHGTKGASR
jgi:hypothetical protein